MCDPILVTLLKMRPQSSCENVTPSSSTSPLPSYKEIPPSPLGPDHAVPSCEALLVGGWGGATVTEEAMSLLVFYHCIYTCLSVVFSVNLCVVLSRRLLHLYVLTSLTEDLLGISTRSRKTRNLVSDYTS